MRAAQDLGGWEMEIASSDGVTSGLAYMSLYFNPVTMYKSESSRV